MTLAKYMERHKLTPTQFAQKIRASDESVRRYLRGARRPSPETMTRIAIVTKGLVTANDFYAMPRVVRMREAT